MAVEEDSVVHSGSEQQLLERKHYILGYGSLISHDSRFRFTDINVAAIAAQVSGWQRSWNMASPNENITCVGALPSDNGDMNGVLVEVDTISEKLRKREQNYHFVELDPADIKIYSAAGQLHQSIDFHRSRIWVCQVSDPHGPKQSHPVCQSYVDTCLSGCLEQADESFARDFIEQTLGWDGYWLNDRQNPLYPRAARVSEETQKQIDALLCDSGLLNLRREV